MSGIETAARVAALREKAARIRFAAAGAQVHAAHSEAQRQQGRLQALEGPGSGAADELANWHSSAAMRAASARAADADVVEANQAKEAALAEWQDLSRRREALDEVLQRWRKVQRAKADASAQRLMDDLAKRRKEWS